MATARDRFNTIVVSGEPRGKFISGYISGTPKPGTIMQLKAATEPVNGLYTYEAYSRDADGDRPRGPYIILCEDSTQGKTIDDAYVSGSVGKLYIPLMGDELLALFKDVSGTGDSHAIGEMQIVVSGTGKLIVTTGSVESEPFVLEETLSALTGDLLALVRFAGP
jgi:hypothetical protein